MSKTHFSKTRIAALAAVLAVLAGPALANDDSAEALARDSGRYLPQAGLAGWDHQTNAFIPGRPALHRALSNGHDVQLDGR